MEWWVRGPPSTQCKSRGEATRVKLGEMSKRMKGVDVEDGTWSGGTKVSLERGQGHELLQRQEQDQEHVIPWVLHSDGADSSCIVPKTKGASRYMHLISKMHLTEELRATGELDCSSAYIRLREPNKSEDKTEGVEAGGRKGRGSDNESRGAQPPKSQALVKIEVDSEECHSGKGGSIDHEERDADARQQIAVPWAWQRHGTAEAGLSWSHRSLALMEGERWL
ncbi:hypothetical protein BHE74_00007716 [Ensete ventricosum]|uniref:Uncharacterized protein n=1 Tax=Ensete ventricosum TaxID=4639 RepID=A0A445MCJ3_ENSVE|nr:hypothetical protein BHE74_00007716 [Ensete ventricosum]RZR71934.1 hypothetical protein BHM03_00008842 [Ensete ventricosum]